MASGELLYMRLRNRASGVKAPDRERPLRIKLTVPCGSIRYIHRKRSHAPPNKKRAHCWGRFLH